MKQAKYEDGKLRTRALDFLQQLETPTVGHAHIQYDHVPRLLGDKLANLSAGRRFAEDSDAVVPVQNLSQTGSGDRLVVGDEHSDLTKGRWGRSRRIEVLTVIG